MQQSTPMEEFLFCWARATMRAEQAEARVKELEAELNAIKQSNRSRGE